MSQICRVCFWEDESFNRDAHHVYCPCCQYVTFVERGAALVCPLCAWCDDSAETADTITEARARLVRGEWFDGDQLIWRIDHEDCALFERRHLDAGTTARY